LGAGSSKSSRTCKRVVGGCRLSLRNVAQLDLSTNWKDVEPPQRRNLKVAIWVTVERGVDWGKK
jgi:hypothetical protein